MNSGTWNKGTWKVGWIKDFNKEGNFKKDWEWDRVYVRSPINPAKYWK